MLFSDLLWVWLCLRVLCADVLALAELQVLVALLRVAEVDVDLVPVANTMDIQSDPGGLALLSSAVTVTPSGIGKSVTMTYCLSKSSSPVSLLESESEESQLSKRSEVFQELFCGGYLTRLGGPNEFHSGNLRISYAVFSMTSLKQHTEYFNFLS